MAEQILRDYEELEPSQTDTWNPLYSDFELGYRMSMFFALTHSLRLCELEIEDLRVLDVGSGNGRSTRAYIDLGLKPEQLVGIDVRGGALDLARSLHPTIRYEQYEDGHIDLVDGDFNWVQAATVFSSIADQHHRQVLADGMVSRLTPGGYVFYLDLWRANWFAGHDVIDARTLFPGLDVIWSSRLRAHQCFPRVRRPTVDGRPADQSTYDRLKRRLRPRTRLKQLLYPSHYVLLARKAES
jgi:SAM-dependent methyltransferase